MTFTEAALEVLRREGKPLHFTKIVELAVRENLLDHVGKVPEDTMADQLAAHARLPRTERRLLTVQHGTFALTEWGLDEDPTGIDGLVQAPVEDLPIRGRERHPIPLRELSRRDAGPRQEQAPGRRRRDEEDRRSRRFPPPAEVAFELLAGAGRPLGLAEIAAQGSERLIMSDAFVRDVGSLRAALLEDNRRREGAGRKALFALEGDMVTLAAEPEPGERTALPAAPRVPLSAAELRRAALASLRRRLRECDPPTVEHVVVKLLEKEGYHELKVAKRGREHVVYTARRRMGVADVRHALRIGRTGSEVSRRDVTDLRRDLGHYGAQIGVVFSAGEANREARGEACAAGQLPVLLVCAEAFAEALGAAGVGAVPVVVPELDDAFFRAAAETAEREESARLARREEREKRRDERGPRDGERRERREPREQREPRPVAAAAAGEGVEPLPVEPASGDDAPVALPAGGQAAITEVPFALLPAHAEGEGAEVDDGDDDDGDDDGPEEGQPASSQGDVKADAGAREEGAQAERRRRRRRRRRRGGRGRGREGAAAQPGAPDPGGQAAPAAGEPPPAPSPPPAGGEPGEG